MRIIPVIVEEHALAPLKAVFDRHRTEWLAAGHSGEWVVVTAAGAHSFHATYEDAWLAGYSAFGEDDYLLQEVLVEDRVGSVAHV